MASLLTPAEKAALLSEADTILTRADLNERQKIVMQMLSGASSNYRYSVAEVCAILREKQAVVEDLHATAQQKIGAGNVQRLGEISNLLTGDFPERE